MYFKRECELTNRYFLFVSLLAGNAKGRHGFSGSKYFPLTVNCTARQCSPLRRKFLKCSINNPALSLLMKHLLIGQRQKAPNFSAFHWSPHGSLVSIGQHFVTTRVVHLPKRAETSFITKSDQSGPNHQLMQLCTASTAWSDSDLAVRAVHSCSRWFLFVFRRPGSKPAVRKNLFPFISTYKSLHVLKNTDVTSVFGSCSFLRMQFLLPLKLLFE